MKMFAGLDLGKKRDYTAVAVLQRETELREPLPGQTEPRQVHVYTLRQLDRVRQESYEDVSDKVTKLMQSPKMEDAKLGVDETGVGSAVTDMLRVRGLNPYAITITGGDKPSRNGNDIRIPKRDLVTVLNVLLESRRLKVPRSLPLAQTLLDEMHNFKVKISPLGHDSYGAGGEWREGQHDDLVLAVAMAAWLGEDSITVGTLFEAEFIEIWDENTGRYRGDEMLAELDEGSGFWF